MGLLRCLNNVLDSLETLFPCSDLLLNSLPFLKFDFAEHVTLDDDYFIELVDLCVDNLVLDSINGPQFNFFLVDLDRKFSISMTQLWQ